MTTRQEVYEVTFTMKVPVTAFKPEEGEYKNWQDMLTERLGSRGWIGSFDRIRSVLRNATDTNRTTVKFGGVKRIK